MRKILIGVALIVALSILSGVLAGPGSLGLHIDTGSVQTNMDRSAASNDQGGGTGQTPKPADQASARKASPKPTGTPIDVDAGRLAANPEAFILLNPTTVAPGATVDISGSGFDPGATVDLSVQRTKSDQPKDIGFAQADQSGSFGGVSFAVPSDFAGSFLVIAKQHNGGKEASAQAQVSMGSPKVTLGTAVGTPGANITFSAEGFIPGETVKVYFNSLTGDPVATFQADQGGGVRRKTIKVPYGAIGNNNFIFVGEKSQAPVTAQFLMLNLYPSVALSSYAAKADTVVTFDGEGFGPSERVRVYLNSLNSPPLGFVETNEKGSFSNAGGFRIPFELKGKNTLIFVGEKSQSAVTASFDVLPYTPYAEASTYGGRPGTTVTFYGTGFARQEVVHIYVGATKQSDGKEVACAKTDDQGNLRAGGSYTVPGNAQKGKLTFKLVGSKSNASALATMEVMDAGGPVQVQAEEKDFKCPYDQPAGGQSQPSGNGQSQSAVTPPAGQPTAMPAQGQQPVPAATPKPQGQAPAAQATPVPSAATGTSSAAGQQLPTVVIANTQGQGTSLLAEPGGQRTVAKLAEGTRLTLTGQQQQANGQVWLNVKDEKGNAGWIDARYLTPAPGQR